MTGNDLLNKRLDLALSQIDMAERMKVPISTYTRLEQNKDKGVPSRYEPAIELIEIQRKQELSAAELKKESAALRRSYDKRIKTLNENKKRKAGKVKTDKPVKKAAGAKRAN